MRIAIVSRGIPSTPYPLNGIFEFDQAKALAAHGHDVCFFAIDLRSLRHPRHYGSRYYIRDGVKVCEVNFPAGRIPDVILEQLGGFFFRLLFARVYDAQNLPDILHAHFAPQAIFARSVKSHYRIPLVYTEHCSLVLSGDRRYQRQLKEACRISNSVVAVSEALSDAVHNLCDCGTCVIPNVIAPEFFEAKRSPSLPNMFRFVSVGSLIPRKNYHELIKAFARMPTNKAHLSIVGEGPLKKELTDLASSLGKQDAIQFHGQQDRGHIVKALSNADCFVLPSKAETFGVVYAEAMAVGLPVIATKCGGPDGFVTSDVGILVDQNDSVALSDAMMAMMTSTFDPKKIRQETSGRFSSEAIAAQLSELYNCVLSAGE